LATHSITDVSLLVHVKDPQNHDAWARFDAKYRPMLVQFCRQKMGMAEDMADEASQQVLVKLVSGMRNFRYDPNRSFRAWLKRVARNSVLNTFRDMHPDRGKGGSVFDGVATLPDRNNDEEELSDRLSKELEECLFEECKDLVRARVTEQTWNAFTMLQSGVKGREVATTLKMKLATVYRVKTRVLNLFREEVTLKLRSKEGSPETSTRENK